MKRQLAIPFDAIETHMYSDGDVEGVNFLMAYIHCMWRDKIIATCTFYREPVELPPNGFDGDRIRLLFPWSVYEPLLIKLNQQPSLDIVDILCFTSKAHL